jgi:hypothetical protein
MAKLSVELQRFFFEEVEPSNKLDEIVSEVTLGDILELAGERIFGFLFVLLALPSALPIPAPGYSIPFGVVIFLLAVQLLAGSEFPWLPQKTLNHRMKRHQVRKLIKAGVPWLQRIEAVSRPRLNGVCTSRVGQGVMGIAIAIMAVSMMIPIPGTNTLPAIGIFIIGFGLLEDDGAISLAGLFVCACALALSTSIIIAVIWGGSSLLDLLKAWLSTYL